mmetsp:Transcript_1111/g.3068  ORF Transcript_1111/g.3068 Transcript_1111/m.3068 type:complete len:118 (-) Transcript_1111:29-382(-)
MASSLCSSHGASGGGSASSFQIAAPPLRGVDDREKARSTIMDLPGADLAGLADAVGSLNCEPAVVKREAEVRTEPVSVDARLVLLCWCPSQRLRGVRGELPAERGDWRGERQWEPLL